MNAGEKITLKGILSTVDCRQNMNSEAIPPFKAVRRIGGAEELCAGRGMYYSKHQSL
jgi:hypothetical protein